MSSVKLNAPISGLTGTAIIVGTVISIFAIAIAGVALGSEYESSCSGKAGEEPVCTTKYVYKGLALPDIDQETLKNAAWFIGTVGGAFATYMAGKKGAKSSSDSADSNPPSSLEEAA